VQRLVQGLVHPQAEGGRGVGRQRGGREEAEGGQRGAEAERRQRWKI
jgi:hypothetical protein